MDKPTFYCDCDGVILNTIEVAFKIMERMGIDIHNRKQVDDTFRTLIDWNDIFAETGPINNSIDKLKLIKSSNIFKDIVILTKISGSYYEEVLKRDYFKETLPDIRVITLQYGLSKGSVVPAKGNILVDDEIGNCERWKNCDGTAILFKKNMCALEDNIINDLEDIVYTEGAKKLLKTRYF